MSDPPRVVYDCNTLLQALARPAGPAGRCVQLALQFHVRLYLSPFVISELREVAARPKVVRKLHLVPEAVNEFCEALQIAGTILTGFPEPFSYKRDPDDAPYINLALAAGAQVVVSRDRDLLDLVNISLVEGRDFVARFPSLRILDPVAFLAAFDAAPRP